jgi:hypothetical protein
MPTQVITQHNDTHRSGQSPISGGNIYLGFASFGDADSYHGWLIAYDAATLNQVGAYVTTRTGERGGIWQALSHRASYKRAVAVWRASATAVHAVQPASKLPTRTGGSRGPDGGSHPGSPGQRSRAHDSRQSLNCASSTWALARMSRSVSNSSSGRSMW